MYILSLENSAKTHYYVQHLNSIVMPQKPSNPHYSTIGAPKKQNMLLYVKNCETKYHTKSGKTLSTKHGDVVYVPKGCEYKVECTAQGESKEESVTLQINFHLFDENFHPFIFSDEILLFSPKTRLIADLFEKCTLLDSNPTIPKTTVKAALLELIGLLEQRTDEKKIDPVLEKGLAILHERYRENPSVAYLANACRVSEEYFRRLFKKQTGQTPVEYKNDLRMEGAKRYLLYTDMPVAEISENLSFATVSHFIKRFKEKFGCSPLSMRNDFKKEQT